MIEKLNIKDFTPTNDATILDVRDEKSFRQGHIQYAKNVPLDALNDYYDTHYAQNNNQHASNALYVLCGGGTKAVRAVELLNERDENLRIVHLIGGTRAARELGFSIIKED